jgi:hypothetical protein
MTQVTTELLRSAVEWLTATGAPNWIVLLTLLTSPWTWAKAIRSRFGTVLDRALPTDD